MNCFSFLIILLWISSTKITLISATPICGSDYQTYTTMDMFRIAQLINPKLDILVVGNCVEFCKDKTIVCANDGYTYNNMCHLGLHMINNPKLTLKHKGHCEGYPELVKAVTALVRARMFPKNFPLRENILISNDDKANWNATHVSGVVLGETVTVPFEDYLRMLNDEINAIKKGLQAVTKSRTDPNLNSKYADRAKESMNLQENRLKERLERLRIFETKLKEHKTENKSLLRVGQRNLEDSIEKNNEDVTKKSLFDAFQYLDSNNTHASGMLGNKRVAMEQGKLRRILNKEIDSTKAKIKKLNRSLQEAWENRAAMPQHAKRIQENIQNKTEMQVVKLWRLENVQKMITL